MSVDHFLMDEPTFRPHGHAGISAVTVLFEDSPVRSATATASAPTSRLHPGDTHWTRAGSGVRHEEIPTAPGTAVHGAQIFVALPPNLELTDPLILNAAAGRTPTVVMTAGASIRVLAGDLDGEHGIDPGRDVTLLDITLPAGARLNLDPSATRTAFAIPIDGSGNVNGEQLTGHRAGGFDPGPRARRCSAAEKLDSQRGELLVELEDARVSEQRT